MVTGKKTIFATRKIYGHLFCKFEAADKKKEVHSINED